MSAANEVRQIEAAKTADISGASTLRKSFGWIVAGCAGCLIVASAPAPAADIARPVYKVTPAAAVYNWTGLYIGGHVGWAGANRDFDQTRLTTGVIVNPGFAQNPDSFIGGGQIGFNQQIGNWVWGLEADMSGADLSERTTVFAPVSGIAQTYDVTLDWMATLTARLGYAWDRWMIYGKGGAAVAHESYALTAPGLVTPGSPYHAAKVTRLGWTVGVGVENALTDNWSWKVEYNYLRFNGDDSIANVLSGTSAIGIEAPTDVAIHAVKTGVNYRFEAASAASDFGPRPVYKSESAAVYDWTGLYVGGHIGWAGAEREFVTTYLAGGAILNPGFTQDPDGFIGGAQIGFNRQAGNWVFGLEADISAADISERTTVESPVAPLTQTYDVTIDWLATLTGRLGYAWDRWMIYGKGGAALMHENYALAIPQVAPRNDAEVTRLGWTIGAGIENALYGNWSWKAEYNYMQFNDYKSINNTAAQGNSNGIAAETNVHVHALKFGVNYKFGGPVVAKY